MADKDLPFDLSRFFFAIPEGLVDEALIKYLRGSGYISADGEEFLEKLRRDKRKVDRLRAKVKGRSVFERIASIAPELLSVEMVNLLRRFDYVNERDGHILRLAIRGAGAIRGGSSNADLAKRAKALLGVGFSEEMVQFLRSADLIDVDDANKLRIALNAASGGFTFTQKALRAKTLMDWLMLSGSTLVDQKVLRAMKLAGIIDARTANAMIEASKYAGAQWTVFEGAKKAEGLAARMAYVVSGSFSWEALRFAQSLGIVPKKYDYLFKIAISLSQAYNRRRMGQLTNRRYRVVPGESPIATFARSSKQTTGELTRLLSLAAKESSRDAKAMKGLNASQRAIRTAGIHQSMRELWEGVGHLTIFGESAAAEAAAEAMVAMQSAFRKQLPADVQRMMMVQAKSGIDSYVSRQENRIQLSRRVYNNLALFNGKIDKRINVHLLKGSSAAEIAADMRRFISPTTPGGVSYAAMRLGRTELANAFHTTTIRYGREQPWVQGFKWNLSGSHGRPDECDRYAGDDHDNLGPGVFKKANVPGKPHPQCLCYLTMVQPSEDVFIRNMKRGYYNQYMTQMIREPDVNATVGERVKARASAAMAAYVLPAAASAYVASRA